MTATVRARTSSRACHTVAMPPVAIVLSSTYRSASVIVLGVTESDYCVGALPFEHATAQSFVASIRLMIKVLDERFRVT